MKKILNQKIEDPYDGGSITATLGLQRDKDGKPIPETDPVTGAPLKNKDGAALYKAHTCPMTTALAVRQFISNAFGAQNKASIDDSDHALRVLAVLRPFRLHDQCFVGEQPKTIELEDADYTWLHNKMKEHVTAVFGVLGKIYLDAIEVLDKVEPPHQEAEAPTNGTKNRLAKVK